MIDCPLLQFLPWKGTQFYRESKGFATLSLMKWTLGADAIQAAVSVIIQTYYISTSLELDEPTTSLQAKALFGLNISFSLIGVISALVTLCLKATLLNRMEYSGEGDSKHEHNNKEEIELHEVPKPVVAIGDVSRKVQHRGSEIELGAVYPSTEYFKGEHIITENPMLGSSEVITPMTPEYLKLVEVNNEIKSENLGLRSENEQMRSEIENLRTENKRLLNTYKY